MSQVKARVRLTVQVSLAVTGLPDSVPVPVAVALLTVFAEIFCVRVNCHTSLMSRKPSLFVSPMFFVASVVLATALTVHGEAHLSSEMVTVRRGSLPELLT